MVIVCGIDGSSRSWEAARAAAALAKLTRDRLTLAYVQEALMLGLDPLTGGMPVALANTEYLELDRERMKVELEREGARLHTAFGVEVRHVMRTGLPDHELIDVVAAEEADLLVVASIGRRASTAWRFGSVADRLSQSAPVALLVVRDSAPLERWALEDRRLSIVLALGGGQPTHAAARAAQALCKLGSCTLSEVHVYDPRAEARRFGLGDPESSKVRGEIESLLARELPGRYGPSGLQAARFVALATHGDVAETLAEYASEQRADLVVLGTHQRGAVRRRFRGSVSYGVLPMVDANVLIVPQPKDEVVPPAPVRPVRRALVATDLSATGNRGVQLALSLLPPGGQLVVLHVDAVNEPPSDWIMGYPPAVRPSPDERKMRRSLAEAELVKLAEERSEGGLETLIEVVEASDVPSAILEAAERHQVDLVCLGTHHHGRVASALLGSVARAVARRSTRPVLLVPD